MRALGPLVLVEPAHNAFLELQLLALVLLGVAVVLGPVARRMEVGLQQPRWPAACVFVFQHLVAKDNSSQITTKGEEMKAKQT